MPEATDNMDSKAVDQKNEDSFHKSMAKSISEIQAQLAQIRKDIQFSVAPKSLELSVETDDLVELAIELWRMERRLNKAIANLPEDQKEMLNNSMQKMKRYLDKKDIEILDHTDQKYDEGQNLEILAVEKDSKAGEPMIKETKEPTILYKGQVIHIGKVIIASSKDAD